MRLRMAAKNGGGKRGFIGETAVSRTILHKHVFLDVLYRSAVGKPFNVLDDHCPDDYPSADWGTAPISCQTSGGKKVLSCPRVWLVPSAPTGYFC